MGDETEHWMKNPASEQGVFAEALQCATAEARAACLDAACGNDGGLRRRVEALLRAAEQAGDFLEQPLSGLGELVSSTLALDDHREMPGDRIARYKLLQQIGEGGCGVVYMAEQAEPVRRRVALKVIKLGMDTRSVIARFEAERQALALMDHPNIAQVFDAGATESGRPYFVMELVRGVPLTDYFDQNHLSTRARLELFIQVCRAVQHAHQKGVIHRDIKPSNILVTMHDGVPVPKVIDFGIAKATTGQQLTDKTLFTAYEQFIGTPAYMSPEQAEMSGLDLDTRTDIYSLGVLLYELLTGKTPFNAEELMRAGLDEMRRTIRDRVPVRPSSRLSTMVMADAAEFLRRRHEPPEKMASHIRGDLDWIVMKALEKDRVRRYETANGLALDVQRYLSHEPVAARPPSAAYRCRKLLRRNKLACTAGGAIGVTLVTGIAVSLWQGMRANREATRATAALQELRATAPVFAQHARALVDRDQFDEAIKMLDYAAKLRPDEPDYLVSKADLLEAQSMLAEALAVYRAALVLAPEHARAAANVRLCEELLAMPRAGDGSLSHESLARLLLAMQKEQRAAAELMPVARRLGSENQLLLEYWLARLQALPIPPHKPLKDRLSMEESGRLSLDLAGTKIADLEAIAGMPLGRLSLAGCDAVSDLSPLRQMPLRTLDLSGTAVASLAGLRGMTSLVEVNLNGSAVTDLSPLAGNALVNLNLDGCKVADLGPLRGMPLTQLVFRNTRAVDLSPLQDMPLVFLDGTGIPATDFAPLAGLPLQVLLLQSTRVSDLDFLRGMPLRQLNLLDCGAARNFRVLADLGELEVLILPVAFRALPEEEQTGIEAMRQHPKLKQIGVEITDGLSSNMAQTSAAFWRDRDIEQRIAGPLIQAGLHDFTLSKFQDGTYLLRVSGQPLRDLSILPPDAPISYLSLANTRVANLAPLHGFPLKRLNISGSPVTDLAPLAGTPLEELYLGSTEVSDLSPLAGLRLKTIFFDRTPVPTVAPLASVRTLREILLSEEVTDVETLRALPDLQRISYTLSRDSSRPAETAQEFWAAYDAQHAARPANP